MPGEKKRYSVTLPSEYVEALDQLVERGIYPEPQDAIRDALRHQFRYHKIEPFYPEAEG